MILPVLLIALLCTADALPKIIHFPEFDDWARFARPSCLEYYCGNGLCTDSTVSGTWNLQETCPGFMLIRPASTKRWKVVLGWRDPATTEITVSQGPTELFSCEKITDNGKYIGLKARSTLVGFEETFPTAEQLFDDPKPITCQFFIGDGNTEVIQDNSQKIRVVTKPPDDDDNYSKVDDSRFIQDVTRKIMCDFTKAQFEKAKLPEDAVEPAISAPKQLSCEGYTKGFQLQFKVDSVYEDVIDSMALCEKDPTTLQYQYKIKTKSGDHTPTDKFHARCYAKRCALCDTSRIRTPEGKIAPTLSNHADGCKALTCPKYYRVGTEITLDKPECIRDDDWKWNWAIGSLKLSEEKTDCVDEMPCKKINPSSCTGGCKLNPNTTYPYCPNTHSLSATIDGKELFGISQIECHTHEGRLYYSGEVNGYFPRDQSNVTFSCRMLAEKPAQAFYRSSGFRDFMSAIAAVAIVLTFPLLYGIVWLIRNIRKLLVERREPAKKSQKTTEKKAKK